MMKSIHAIWKDGRIVPTQPVDWPDGTSLTVEPVEDPRDAEPVGDVFGDDPSSVARWIASFDSLPAMQMSTEEEAEWRAARQRMKDFTIAKMHERPAEDQP